MSSPTTTFTPTAFTTALNQYLNASYPLLWVQTFEETRMTSEITAAFLAPEEGSGRHARAVYEWDSVRGVRKIERNENYVDQKDTVSVKKMLEWIASRTESRMLFLLRDFHPFFTEPVNRRFFRNMIGKLKHSGSTILFISPIVAIPEELTKEVQLMEFSLPDAPAIENRLGFIQRAALQTQKAGAARAFAIPEDIKTKAIEAAKGLTNSEVENAFTLALVRNKEFNQGFVDTVFSEKVTQVKKNGLLTYLEPDVTFDQVGGLDGLKVWIRQRGLAYTTAARSYGLPYPRGVLLCGVAGCGKTMLAKATCAELKLPGFQLDVGALFGKMVGETEQNFRKVIQIVDGIGSCILFIDEIEKALNRAAVSGAGDTGTSSRSFGTLLSWMADHKSPVFVIGTSNNFLTLPAEMIRKGRFDELFWLDLPTEQDREAIFVVTLRRYNRDPKKFNVKQLAKNSATFTGAEIDAVITSAMFRCFADGQREITTNDILTEIKGMTPQAEINKEGLREMREEAQGKLRMAGADGVVADVPENLRDIAL